MGNNKQIKSKLQASTIVAQRCPVCNGFGTLKFGSLKCHACKGKGYLLISVEERSES